MPADEVSYLIFSWVQLLGRDAVYLIDQGFQVAGSEKIRRRFPID